MEICDTKAQNDQQIMKFLLLDVYHVRYWWTVIFNNFHAIISTSPTSPFKPRKSGHSRHLAWLVERNCLKKIFSLWINLFTSVHSHWTSTLLWCIKKTNPWLRCRIYSNHTGALQARKGEGSSQIFKFFPEGSITFQNLFCLVRKRASHS